MRLVDEDIIIRLFNQSDVKYLLKWWNDGEVMNHIGFPRGLNVTTEEILEGLNSKKQQIMLMIEYNQVVIGEIAYQHINETTVSIGIKIGELTFHGRGIGTKCIKLLIDYLFDRLNYQKIVLDVNMMNKRAWHVYEKIGFKVVNIEKDSWVDQLGRKQSRVDCELKKEDYVK